MKFISKCMMILVATSWALSAKDAIQEIQEMNETLSQQRKKRDEFTPLAYDYGKGLKLLNGEESIISKTHANDEQRRDVMSFLIHRALATKELSAKKPTYILGKKSDQDDIIGHQSALYLMQWSAYYLAKHEEFYAKTAQDFYKVIKKKITTGKLFSSISSPSPHDPIKNKIREFQPHLARLFGGDIIDLYRNLGRGYKDRQTHQWLIKAGENRQRKDTKYLPAYDLKGQHRGNLPQPYYTINDAAGKPVAYLKPKNPGRPDNRVRHWQNEVITSRMAKCLGLDDVVNPVYDYDDDYTIEPFISLIPHDLQGTWQSNGAMKKKFDDVNFKLKLKLQANQIEDFKPEKIFPVGRMLQKIGFDFHKQELVYKLDVNEFQNYESDFDPINIVRVYLAKYILGLYDSHPGNIAVQIQEDGKLTLKHFDLEYAMFIYNPLSKYDERGLFLDGYIDQMSGNHVIPSRINLIIPLDQRISLFWNLAKKTARHIHI